MSVYCIPETGNNDSSAFEASAEAKAKITTGLSFYLVPLIN